jgi:diacylglycerol kinase (ATP)
VALEQPGRHVGQRLGRLVERLALEHERLVHDPEEQGILHLEDGLEELVGLADRREDGRVAGAVARSQGTLGIVPIGRGNDFARHLGLPSGAEELAAMLLSEDPRRVDLMEAHGTLVAGCLYTGIDALANMHGEGARMLGGAAYHYGALRALAGWRPASYRITVDGDLHRVRGYTVVVANTGYYGNGRRAAPQAVEDDGALDVVVLHHAPRRTFLKIAMSDLYTGAHLERREVEVLRGHEIRVEADRALPCGGDGEILGPLPVTARVRPGMLQVVGPTTIEEEGPR